MLIIAGVGYKTLFRLTYEPRFFGPWKQMTKVISRVAGDPHREGDGRVPLASAALESHGGLIWELLPAEDLHSARINESRNPILRPPLLLAARRWRRGLRTSIAERPCYQAGAV